MKKIHWFTIAGLVLAILVLAGPVRLRVKQYRFQRTVERLLTDMRGLEIHKSGAEQAATIARRHGFSGGPCAEKDCNYYIELDSPTTGILLQLQKSAPESSIVSPLVHVISWVSGGRPAIVRAAIHIKQSRVSSGYFSIMTGGADAPMLFGLVDMNDLHLPESHSEPPAVNLDDSLRHGGYRVGSQARFANADTDPIPVTTIWTEFEANVTPEDKSRLMEIRLDCITRWRACTAGDLMPAAWAQHLKDQRERTGSFVCTMDLARHVAQMADATAVVRSTNVALKPAPYDETSFGLLIVKPELWLKRPRRIREDSEIDVEVAAVETALNDDTGSKMKSGQSYIVLMQMPYGSGIPALFPCGVLTMNKESLAMVRSVTQEIETAP